MIPVIIGGGLWTAVASAIIFMTPLAKVAVHPTLVEEV